MSFKSRINTRYGPGVIDIIKDLEKSMEKLALNTCHLTFLMKCRDFDIVPKRLKIKIPYD
jgi:hypothetical protein